jgi:hypothetical protein
MLAFNSPSFNSRCPARQKLPSMEVEVEMNELVARVAAAAGISTEQAQRAINLVLAFLKREAPAEFDELRPYLPEADAAVAAGEIDQPKGGGLMGGLMNMIGGGGGLMGLASQLTGIGLSTGEMTSVGKEIFDFARERAGDERVSQVAHAIPGLSQLL